MSADAVKAAHLRLLEALRMAFNGPLVELAAFLPGPLPAPEDYRPRAAAPVPMLERLPATAAHAGAGLEGVVAALVGGAPHFHWRRSYTKADGVDDHFLANYGYIDIATPEGPFLASNYRLTAAYWGADIIYPEHWHEPEELYAIVAGAARFRAAGRAPRDVGAGEFVLHEANQLHATDMIPGPLLCVIGWRGGDLMKFPQMDVSLTA